MLAIIAVVIRATISGKTQVGKSHSQKRAGTKGEIIS